MRKSKPRARVWFSVMALVVLIFCFISLSIFGYFWQLAVCAAAFLALRVSQICYPTHPDYVSAAVFADHIFVSVIESVPNQSPEPMRVGAGSSASRLDDFWSRMAQLSSLGCLRICKHLCMASQQKD
jgi:hypothetical protein